ncbi:roadblock/LC7 domain-containing protein [Streptomyces sp. L2]|uniref:roadblock/LC7 domain-containing protein n=1 Tax=Streptomyces sp. L2 TaxID=2162665 RepID=UPI0010129E13|nr:roadblock/LC7 domain-containing protein [Streptomyces sp. L2]
MTTPLEASTLGGTTWLLGDLVRRVAPLRHAVLLSGDGLVTAATRTLNRAEAERLAAMACGLHGLARGAGECFGTSRVRYVVIDFAEGFLFVCETADGGRLALVGDAGADQEQIAVEAARFAERLDAHPAMASRAVAGPRR